MSDGSSSSSSSQVGSTVGASTRPSSALPTRSTTTRKETTVAVTTTFTSSSQRCVATLEGQVLLDGSTALIISNGTLLTLNHTCQTLTASPTTLNTVTTSSNSTTFSTSTPSSKPHHNGVSPGMIAGVVIGILAVVACLAGAVFWLWYRRRRSTSIFTLKAKMLDDEDRSGEVPIRWEKDSAEITESDSAEIKEMSAGPLPVEMGDGRSIKEPMSPMVASPISVMTMDSCEYGLEDIVSPLSPR